MNKFLPVLLGILIVASIVPSLVSYSYAQTNTVIPPRHQWKTISDIDELTCKQGLVLLQKNNGAPACVSPYAYLKLVDRGYGVFDTSIMMNRPNMMNNLMKNMAANENLMQHWHQMMQNDPIIMQNTMSNWASQMKKNLEFLANAMGPMTSDPQLREQMIDHMRNHPNMEEALQQHPEWMKSVHQQMGPGMQQGMGQQMGHGMNQEMSMSCPWCPDYEDMPHNGHGAHFSNFDRMMDMIHKIWINQDMTQDMHQFMLENPSHMGQMADQMLGPMLGSMMDDPELRQKMIEMMLEHSEFMDSIRHENTQVN